MKFWSLSVGLCIFVPVGCRVCLLQKRWWQKTGDHIYTSAQCLLYTKMRQRHVTVCVKVHVTIGERFFFLNLSNLRYFQCCRMPAACWWGTERLRAAASCVLDVWSQSSLPLDAVCVAAEPRPREPARGERCHQMSTASDPLPAHTTVDKHKKAHPLHFK